MSSCAAMSYDLDTVTSLTPATAGMIWYSARNNHTSKAKIEIDTFLGSVVITNQDWAVRTPMSVMGTQTVIENLRSRWDSLRESGISDEMFEKIALQEAEEALKILKSNCPTDIEIMETKIDGESVGN